MPANSPIEEQFLKRLTELTEANLTNEQFGVSELAREMNMSRSSIHRKLRAISKQNISQFIRKIRLEKAKELLMSEDLTASEISYRVGFGSPTYFSKCFHEYFGVTPGEFGKRNLTEPESSEQPIDTIQANSGKRLKIALILASLLVIISLTAFFIVFKPFSGGKNKLEKTIAVLPFVDYSPAEGNSYIISGLREEILDKLEKIQDLRVKSRTAVEKYKDTKLSVSDIAKELKVNYILDGSGQKINDKIRIRLQLIEAGSGNHLWSKPYEEAVNNENIFDIQEEVALSVAKELGAVLHPNEKVRIIRKPTQNSEAYTLYLRGLDYLNIYYYKKPQIKVPEAIMAKQCFEQAIKLDSTFTEAYVRLGHIYMDILLDRSGNQSIRQQYLDSGMMMVKKVFLYDSNNSWAYGLRGKFYFQKGMFEKANEDFDKSFELSPKNDYSTYYGRFWQFFGIGDFVNAIKYFYQGKALQPNEILSQPALLMNVSQCLAALGFPEISRKYLVEYLKQTKDSSFFFFQMAEIERFSGNFKNAVIYDLKFHEFDAEKIRSSYNLLKDQMVFRDYKNAYKYLIDLENIFSKTGKEIFPEIFAGYIYLKNGDVKKADYHLKGSAKALLRDIESNGVATHMFYSYWELAKIYSIMGEKRKALDNLKMLKNRKTDYAWQGPCLKNYPFFDFIRNEPEFVDVLKDVEEKYQKVHERAGKLLKEYGELE